MTRNLAKLFLFSVTIVLFASFGFSQDRDTIKTAAGSQYLISARAGGVNYISGRVSVVRNDSTSGYLLKGDSVEVGEEIVTSAGSRTEILLNPGSYARVDENSSFEFATTELDDLQLQLNRGSAIFEVYAGNGFYVTVLTPSSRFYLIKSGVYRVDVMPNGTSRIEVRKGKAQVGNLDAKKLGKGKSAIISGTSDSISKFKRSERDNFETWSRERARGLAEANARLKSKNVTRSVFGSSAFNNRSTFFGSGVWAYDPFYGSYCYLPFGYGGRSPYGFGLRRNIGYNDFNQRYYYYQRQVDNSRRSSNVGSFTEQPSTSANPGNTDGTTIRRRARLKNSDTIDGLPAQPKRRSEAALRGSSPRATPTRRQPRRTPPRQPRTQPRQPRAEPRRVNPPRPQPRRASPPPRRSTLRSEPPARSRVNPKNTDQ